MSYYAIKIKGFKTLKRRLLRDGTPLKSLDSIFKKVVLKGERDLKTATIGKGDTRTGLTSRSWMISKKGRCDYRISNKTATKNGNYSIAEILDKGRGVVYPKKAKILYIPLTSKGTGKEGTYGIDFVLAKKSKAVKGRFFIKKEEDRASRALSRGIITLLRKAA